MKTKAPAGRGQFMGCSELRLTAASRRARAGGGLLLLRKDFREKRSSLSHNYERDCYCVDVANARKAYIIQDAYQSRKMEQRLL